MLKRKNERLHSTEPFGDSEIAWPPTAGGVLDLKTGSANHTVDGKNPAPPGMYNTL